MKSRLRDTIEELRRSLQPKESALEALQQSLMEKEQVRISLKRLTFCFQNFALMHIESPVCSCLFMHVDKPTIYMFLFMDVLHVFLF